jgi:hypothetical protein
MTNGQTRATGTTTMQLYQLSQTFTAATCAVLFLIAQRYTRDRVVRVAQIVWALAMVFAAIAAPLNAYTNYDIWVTQVARWVTPVGWSALAVIAAREISRRGR